MRPDEAPLVGSGVMRPRALLLLALFAPPAFAAPDDDEEAPHISHEDIDVSVAGQDLLVVASIEDPSGVFDPTVLYRVGEEGAFLRAPMEPTGDGAAFSATIPGNFVVGDIHYFIEAFDELGNGPARYGNQELPLRIRVVAPTVAGPEGDVEPPKEPGQKKAASEAGEGEAEEGSGLGLWLGLGAAGAGAAALVAVAAVVGGGVGAFLLLNNMNNNTPGEVTVVVSGPSVTPSALTGTAAGGAR